MAPFRRLRNRTTFHVTDVENLYAALRDNNYTAAVRHAARVLDRGLNGPADGLPRTYAADFSYGPAERDKMLKLADEMEKMLGGQQSVQDTARLASRSSPFDSAEPQGQMPAAGTGAKGKAKESQKEVPKIQPAVEQKTGDDAAPGDQSPHPMTPPTMNLFADDDRAASIPWEAISQIIMLVIQLIRGWQQG